MVDSNRRRLMVGAASMAAVAVATDEADAKTPNVAVLEEPEGRLDAFCRMRCGPEGAKSWIGYQGTFFGKVAGAKAVPLMGIIGMSWNRAIPEANGRYRYVLDEAGYMTNLSSGDVMNSWVNPLNDLRVEPQHYRSGQTTIFTPDTVTPVADLPASVDYTGTISRPIVQRDSIWMSEDLLVELPNPPERYEDERMYSGPKRVATSLATFLSPLTEALDPEAAFVPCSLSYTTINSWRPWMLMGQTPGVISWRLVGQKVAGPEQLPRRIVGLIERDHPELLAGNE